jgi:hypothetical protein
MRAGSRVSSSSVQTSLRDPTTWPRTSHKRQKATLPRD